MEKIVLDPTVDRETVNIMGKDERCLGVFAGIEKYSYEEEGTMSDVKNTKELMCADQLQEAIADNPASHENANQKLRLTGVPILLPPMPDECVQDITFHLTCCHVYNQPMLSQHRLQVQASSCRILAPY